MHLWFVGAAAAAGYIAKNWQKISRDRDSLSELPAGAFKDEKPESVSCPFHKWTWQNKVAEDTSTNGKNVLDGRLSDMSQLENTAEAESEAVPYGIYDVKPGMSGNYEDCNALFVSSLPPGFSTTENPKENEGGNELSCEKGYNSCKACMGETDFSHHWRNRGTLRAKRSYSYFVKPLTSLESCIMAQWYEEHAKMEEYMLSVHPSPSTTMRPLLVTDGNQIISRAKVDSFNTWIGTDSDGLHVENMCGVPPLPKIKTLDSPKKINSNTGKAYNERSSRSHKTGDVKCFLSQNGTNDGLVLLCLGISIGIISSVIADRKEIYGLKELLKQTENLVQDLQEELEMKDSLTVKELLNENNQSLDTHENSFRTKAPNPLFPVQSVHNSTKNDGKELYIEKVEASSESMSKIEAELEAELERLGLNMNMTNLERKLSDFVELDPDFVADFAQGELRADMDNGRAVAQPESNPDAIGTSTTHSANYAVSPQELSLRLHGVIQSRLEERVKELEMALQNSQRKVQLMESERRDVWRKLSSSELRFSSGKESPVAKEDCNSVAQPLVMNLSGEALDAYSEAYEELTRMNESEEEDSPSGYENNCQMGLHSFDQSLVWGHSGGENELLNSMYDKEKSSEGLYIRQLKTSVALGSSIQESLNHSEDENSDCNEEMEKLIEQIVEKTRKGSPVVLNAHKLLFAVEESEH